MMKKIIGVFSFIVLIGSGLNAQEGRPGFEKYLEKFKSEKVSFLTEKLDLTVEEAQKFWPLYNEYQDKRDVIIRSQRMDRHGRGTQERTSKELEAMVDQKVEQEVELAELKLEFHKKVKKAIPIEKVVKLYRAEKDFMNYMLGKIRGQERGRRNRDNAPD